MQRDQARLDAETGEQAAGVARVLGRHRINRAEHGGGAWTEIVTVADGRGNDIKCVRLD